MMRRIYSPLFAGLGGTLAALALLSFLLHGPMHRHGGPSNEPDAHAAVHITGAGCTHALPHGQSDERHESEEDFPSGLPHCPICLVLAAGGLYTPPPARPLPAPPQAFPGPSRPDAAPPCMPLLAADAAPRAPPLLSL